MKRIIMGAACLLITELIFAQKDTSIEKTDTLTVGNFIILKKKTGTLSAENNYPTDGEYRSNKHNYKRDYSFNNLTDMPDVSRLVDQVVYAAVSVGDYFSRFSFRSLSSLNDCRPKTYKIKKSKKQPHSIKINGDRYVLDKADDKDSD